LKPSQSLVSLRLRCSGPSNHRNQMQFKRGDVIYNPQFNLPWIIIDVYYWGYRMMTKNANQHNWMKIDVDNRFKLLGEK